MTKAGQGFARTKDDDDCNRGAAVRAYIDISLVSVKNARINCGGFVDTCADDGDF